MIDRRELLALLELAYGEPLEDYLGDIGPGRHLVRRHEGQLISHAMWVERWVQVGEGPLLRAAYVELVGTHPDWRGRGLARGLMVELLGQLEGFDLAALAPAETRLYEHLGWQRWRGPLLVRRDGALEPADPDEAVLVHAVAGGPELDLDAPLSVPWRPGEVF